MKITIDWLKANTNNGAMNKKQRAILNTEQKTGWMQDLVGVEISNTDARAYCAARKVLKSENQCPKCGYVKR